MCYVLCDIYSKNPVVIDCDVNNVTINNNRILAVNITHKLLQTARHGTQGQNQDPHNFFLLQGL